MSLDIDEARAMLDQFVATWELLRDKFDLSESLKYFETSYKDEPPDVVDDNMEGLGKLEDVTAPAMVDHLN